METKIKTAAKGVEVVSVDVYIGPRTAVILFATEANAKVGMVAWLPAVFEGVHVTAAHVGVSCVGSIMQAAGRWQGRRKGRYSIHGYSWWR